MPAEDSSSRLGPAIITAAAVFVVIWGVQNLAGIINPILLALVITIAMLPVPRWLIKRGVPTWLALILTILVVVLVLLALGWMVLVSLGSLDIDVSALNPLQTEEVVQSESFQAVAADIADSIIRQVNINQFTSVFSGIVVAAGGAVAQLGLTFFVFFFMLYTALSIPNLSKVGINSEAKVVNDVLALTDGVRRYVVVTTGLNFLVGAANTVLLWFFDIPFALLWGLLAWFLGYIPAVGFWLALIPPVLIAYSQYGLTTALIIFVGYVLINGTVANIIQPRVMGASLRISPLIVFISVFIWASLLGSIGAILAIPLTMLIIAILGAFEQTEWLASLMRYVPGATEQPDEAVSKLRQMWDDFRTTLTGN